jgi:hypothetical protein
MQVKYFKGNCLGVVVLSPSIGYCRLDCCSTLQSSEHMHELSFNLSGQAVFIFVATAIAVSQKG